MVIWRWSSGGGRARCKPVNQSDCPAGGRRGQLLSRRPRSAAPAGYGTACRCQRDPKGVIAPHAGYAYSGQIAAAAFATLRDGAQRFARVVVIGPAHYVPIRGIALPTVDAFETPLGRLPVDRDAVSEIADLPFVLPNDAAHAPEHALEVELPFLQIVLPSFSF